MLKEERLKLAIAGASGRMGKMLIEAALADSTVQLVGALEQSDSIYLSQDAGLFCGQTTGVKLSDQVEQVLSHAECLIDFTRPQGTLNYLSIAQRLKVNMVIGTTGFTEEGLQQIRQAAEHIGIVHSSNMSLGVNVTLKLIKFAAKYFSEGYDIEIIEAHHRHKVDAPSGTALMMGQAIADVLERDLEKAGVFARHGHTGERAPSEIGFSTIRGGDIVGDHTVLFAGLGERIEITHKASSRQSYAQGALCAAHFLKQHQRGLFNMQAVLGL